MGALFSIDGMFTLTGRGLVLAGQIAEGVIRVGDHVRLPVDGDRLVRVTAVEMGHLRTLDGSPGGFVGLVLGELPAGEIPGVRAALSPGQVLQIDGAT